MAQTNSVFFAGKTFTFKTKNKALMETVKNGYWKLINLTSHKKELRGIIGIDEDESGSEIMEKSRNEVFKILFYIKGLL